MSINRRKRNITVWKRRWVTVAKRCGAVRTDVRHLTKMTAFFLDEDAAEIAVDELMQAGFAVAWLGHGVQGFPDAIQNDETGEPTEFAALDR